MSTPHERRPRPRVVFFAMPHPERGRLTAAHAALTGVLAVMLLAVSTLRAEPHVTYSGEPLKVTLVLLSQEDDTSRTRIFRWMYRDAGALARSVATPKFLLYTAGTAAATLGLAALDDDARDAAHGAYHGPFRDALGVVDYLGGPLINVPVVLVAGGSLLTHNTRFQDAALTSLQTLVYAGLIGYGLKTVFGRERPEWSDDPYAFFSRSGMNPFLHEGNSSFPGGHAIAAFGIVTPWVLYYPSPVTYALYALPIGTGLSRVAAEKHWATDIAVGALIGITMGRWLTRRHRDEDVRPQRLSISVGEDGRLFSVRLNLP